MNFILLKSPEGNKFLQKCAFFYEKARNRQFFDRGFPGPWGGHFNILEK